MAVVRARSAPPYALFVSIFLCVVFAGLAIVLYVAYSKGVEETKAAQDTLSKVAGAPDQMSLQRKGLLDPRNPAAHQMLAQIDQLNAMIAGANTTATPDSLKDDPDIKAALEKYTSLKNAVKTLTTDRDEKATSLAQANALAKAASDRASASEKKVADLTAAYQQSIAQVTDQLNKANEALAAADQARDAAVGHGNDAVNQAQTAAEEARRNLVLQNADLTAKLAQMTKDLQDIRDRLKSSAHGNDTLVGEPDGSILRVNAVANEVYISLTSKDRILPGMTFTAYDVRLGVRYGTDEAAQGNGSVEVIEVGETSSRARITHVTPGHAIQIHDVIANVVYHNDKTRKSRFVIYGDFDLDGDGIPTAAERERLVSMIRTWGGQVDDNVTSQTDYLVLGTRPASPTIIDDANATASAPAAGSIGDERSKQQNRYDDLEAAARSLSIPVLNANRFLAMIGYYNTTIVRY